MKKRSIFQILLAMLLYLALFVLGSSCGLIHPACYAYAGTFLPLLFGFVYLYVAATIQGFGAALLLNGFVLLVGLLAGEGKLPLLVGLVVLALLAECIRRWQGYDTLTGVRLSFLPFAFSFYAYSAHWWTDAEGALAAAVEEMPAGYAEAMQPVIENTALLVLMLVLTVPMAILGMFLAEKILKKHAQAFK